MNTRNAFAGLASLQLFLLTGLLTGCADLAPVRTVYNQVQKKAPAKPCAVTLQLENREGDKVRMLSEKACLDLSGESVALPTDLKLWLNDNGAWNNYGVCRNGSVLDVPPVNKADGSVDEETKGVKTCQWNGTFRHTYPWTVLLESHTGPLRESVQAVRVFRNGALAFVWVPKPTEAGNSVVIAGSDLTGRLMPESAPMDLRIIPTGVTVDAAVLAATVQRQPSQWDTQFRAARDALVSSPSLANGKLKEETDCIVYRAKMVSYRAAEIAGRGSNEPTAPANCMNKPAPMTGDSLRKRYEKLKGTTQATLDELQKQFLEEIAVYRAGLSAEEEKVLAAFEAEARLFWQGEGAWWAALQQRGKANSDADRAAYIKLLDDPAKRRLVMEGKPPVIPNVPAILPAELTWLQTRGTPAELELFLSRADALVSQGLQAVDDTIALQAQLRKDAVRIAGSTDEQARLLLRVANSLQGTSPLQPIRENPEMLSGERGLAMRYSDRWQFFAIAPWTAFPVSFKGDADFTAANLIPIIDVLGWRYQFASNRLADIRAGIGTTALSFTAEEEQTDATTGAVVKKDVEHLRIVPEANFGIGNIKLGLSYIFAKHLEEEQRWRVLVGADLYKLISGSNLEAF